MTATELRTELARLLEAEPASIDLDTDLHELVQDSFQLVEIVVGMQEFTGAQLTQDDLGRLRTVRDLLDRVASELPTGSGSRSPGQ